MITGSQDRQSWL